MTLKDKGCLKGAIIDDFFKILQSHFNKKQSESALKIYCVSGFFYDFLTGKEGYSKVQPYTEEHKIKENSAMQNMTSIFDFDLLFMPINVSFHWILVVINFKDKKLQYYDSMKLKRKKEQEKCFRVNFISILFSFF